LGGGGKKRGHIGGGGGVEKKMTEKEITLNQSTVRVTEEKILKWENIEGKMRIRAGGGCHGGGGSLVVEQKKDSEKKTK